jgi:S-adenosyl-L-methionine hydrolase (adenosine-forming)
VAAMKAVILAACPAATLVDVSHSVPAFDIEQGGFVLWAGTRHFAPGAVHLVVVDPGVGGRRRPVALSLGDSIYVGPDNGVFGLLGRRAGVTPDRVVELPRTATTSPTFEGRDVFAAAAGALAAGTPLERIGTAIDPVLVELPDRGPRIVWVDAFGNLVTSLERPVTGLRVNGREIRAQGRTFSDAPAGKPFLYMGSMGFVEIGVREARADVELGAQAGTLIEPLT